VNHSDGTHSLFYAPTFVLAKRDGDRYLANPLVSSVAIGPWEGPKSAVTYRRDKGEVGWQNLGHRGRIATAGMRVRFS
jgi:hypothetical protein